jgi:hypothetical protein
MICGDKMATVEVLDELGEDSGVSSLPTRLLMVEELMAAGGSDLDCKRVVCVCVMCVCVFLYCRLFISVVIDCWCKS